MILPFGPPAVRQASAPGSFCWQARSLFPAWWRQSCCRGVFPCSALEDAAKCLGLEVERSRFLCLLTVLLLAGGAVALTGPVAFVGLVPHVVRFFTGADYRAVIPCSMAAGAFFMLTADIISRTINAPAETPIGLIFSLIGVPFFIWIARKEDKGFD